MVKRFLSIRLIYSVIFICSVFPANASQYKASVLQSRIYAGQQLTQTDDDYFKSFGVVASENDAASTVISNPYNFSKLPLLIGLPVDKVTPYVRMYGPIFDSPLVNLEPRTLDFQVDDVEVNTFFAKKVSATELFYYPSSEEASREVEAVGYYLHDGNLTTSNYIFHDAVIFNPKQTPYYQEIRKKFKRSNTILFKTSKSKFENKRLKFYHLKRNDGYIESYAFYEIPDRYNFKAKRTLIFQGLYPKNQEKTVAEAVKEKFKEHFENVKLRYKKMK